MLSCPRAPCERQRDVRLLPARVPRPELQLPSLRRPVARLGSRGPGARAARRHAQDHLDPVGPRSRHGSHAGPSHRRRTAVPSRLGHDDLGLAVGLAGGPRPRKEGGAAESRQLVRLATEIGLAANSGDADSRVLKPMRSRSKTASRTRRACHCVAGGRRMEPCRD